MFKSLAVANSRESFRIYLFIAIVLVGSLTIFRYIDRDSFVWFASEDSLAENFTALFYFAAGIILITNSIKRIKKRHKIKLEILSILFGILFIFFAGEEISWGQRIFNISEPIFFSGRTFDNDLSVHNLYVFGHPLIEGNRILNLFVLFTGVALPVAYIMSRRLRKFLNSINFPIVPISCAPILFLAFWYGFIMARVSGLHECIETKEFVYSLGFFLFSLSERSSRNRLD